MARTASDLRGLREAIDRETRRRRLPVIRERLERDSRSLNTGRPSFRLTDAEEAYRTALERIAPVDLYADLYDAEAIKTVAFEIADVA